MIRALWPPYSRLCVVVTVLMRSTLCLVVDGCLIRIQLSSGVLCWYEGMDVIWGEVFEAGFLV